MMMRRQVSHSLLIGAVLVLVLGLGALAQSVSLTVTSYSDAVRFSAQGAVKELRVEVLSLFGQKVFDSGPVLSNTLDWKLLNTQGQPVANGVYIYTVTVKDPFGNVTKKLGKLVVLRGKGIAAPPLSGITVGDLATGNPRLQMQWDITGNYTIQGNLGVGTETLTNAKVSVSDGSAPEASAVGIPASRTIGVYGSGSAYFLGRDVANDIEYAMGISISGYAFLGAMTGHDLRFRTNNVDRLTIQAGTGNVGIGTTNPTHLLHVEGASAGIKLNRTGGVEGFILIYTDASGGGQIRGLTVGGLRFTNNDASTEWVRVTGAGNVGIGTSSPSAKTHINNTANQPGLRIDSSDGQNALEIYNTGSGSATGLIFRVERTTGNVYADGSFTGGGADVAERIDATEPLEAGDVVEIDPDNPGKFRKAREAMSTRVAGVISTAPGVVLGNKDAVTSSDARPILALAGRVPVKATAKFGAISVGDLLVSSPIPGYAMKCPEANKCIGAVIGKALEPLSEGVGMIEVQVMLR